MKRPDVTLATPWHFPTPSITHLPNGLCVWHFHLPGQHITTFEAVLPAALASEPREAEGVGTVTLHAGDEGTLAHPDGRIGELLEANGATLHGLARHRYTTFGGQAPSRRLDAVLELFTEVLGQPAYAERDIMHHVEAQVASFDSTLASPGGSNRLALRRALFGEQHRDGRPAAGTPETLAAITAEHVRSWYKQHCGPEHTTLLIAGATDAESVLERFGDWAPRGIEACRPAAAPVQPPRVLVVDQPEAVQATVAIAQRAVTRDDPRWAALRIAGHALAGAFASRLNLKLRERLGYTYGVSGGFAPGVAEGQFTVGTSVRTEVAADAVARLLEGIALTEPLSVEEVDDARRYLVGVAPLANETSADIVAQASALAASGLEPSYMAGHFRALGEVDADAATAAYREVVSPQNCSLAITGDATTLLPQLEKVGLSPELIDLRG